MLDLILMFVMIFTNSGLARRKGKSPFLWGLFTLLAFVAASSILGAFYVLATYPGKISPDDVAAVQEYIIRLQEDTLKVLLISMFGVGGGLIIRSILSRMPDQPSSGPANS